VSETALGPSGTKQAEKEYLARAGTDRWERVKPFSSAGHDDVAEGARLIHDFAAAVLCLAPQPGQRVLDLGAGSCWVSEWLRRFNVETVSVDLAADMLAIGRARLGPDAWIVAGDLETLPLASESVDHAVCLNAFHHVPDGPAALAQVCRVLRPGGRLLLSEPGRGHADAATSVGAVATCGVQERDVIAAAVLADCRKAGFRTAALKPLAHVVPWYDLDAERWAQWERYAAERRPLRAVKRIVRAIAEGLGVRRQTLAFEDTLRMEVLRIVKGSVDHHPILLASK
jgi:ubiquinone/menaquinone biosynthesis C-methylase UbiE